MEKSKKLEDLREGDLFQLTNYGPTVYKVKSFEMDGVYCENQQNLGLEVFFYNDLVTVL